MNIILTLRQIYYYIFVWCLHFAWRLGLYEPKKIETFLDIDRKYIDPLKTKFAKTFESSINYNENISPIFYDKKEYNEYMQTTNTELEKIWKTIEEERITGYEHRAPKKKVAKNQIDVSINSDLNSYSVKNMPVVNRMCLIKLDEDGNTI